MSQDLSLPAPGSTGQITFTFWAKKLHSLSGVLPIGAFLLEHLWTNSHAIRGPEAFDDAVRKLTSLPYLVFIEIGLIGLPILYHSLYGIVITLQGRPNNLGYRYARNWMYTLQRVSGIILFGYIGLHVYETRIRSAIEGVPMTFEYMASYLGGPGIFAIYVIGVLSAVFHFANGLWAFLIGWGVTTTQRAMRLSAYACTAIGLGLGALGINALLAFYGKAITIGFY